jgi:outer membrane protein assembly factor BamB
MLIDITLMAVRGSRLGATLALVGSLLWVAPARANWTTYRGDAARSGIDWSSTGSLPFSSVWGSQTLPGDVYGQPLIYNGLVIVATESNDVYALNESTGQVVWHRNVGIPVPDSQLPCGDISPTVGITSTPVVDPETNRVFVVADTWNGSNASSIRHQLAGFNVADGTPVQGLPIAVDPPGQDPTAQLQRTALALDGGRILIGYGGNAGDCGNYHGWVVTASETGGSLLATFEVEPNSGSTGGAIWGSGTGAAVDSAGNIWVATGNGFSGDYEYQESVLKLDPNLSLLDSWAPSNWATLDSTDTDLGSGEPLLLPGGLVFQIGKEGVGYLLRTSGLGGTGGAPAFQAQVCGSTTDASFGGAIYANGVIYATCEDGLRALSLNTAAPSFAPLPGWQVTSAVTGPPIFAGGLVWANRAGGGGFDGLDPNTGQPTVTQSTSGLQRFTTPSASDGKLFVATLRTVQAYTIAKAAPPSPPGGSPPSTPAGGATPSSASSTATCGCSGARCRLTVALKVPRHARVIAAKVIFNRKVTGSKHGRKLKRLSFTPPRNRRIFTIKLRETTSDHRHLTIFVHYRQCRRVRR